MQRYGNLSGHSGVVGFEIHRNSIVVQFRDGAKYEYTIRSAGTSVLATMKQLALAGRGLSTFISQKVKSAYARKFH